MPATITTATTASGSDVQSPLEVSIDWSTAVVVLRGELDRDVAHHLVDALGALVATGHRRWTVDTAEVTWCDVGGLRALAAGHALAVAHGRELRLARPSRCVQRLVTLSGLDQRIAGSVAPAGAAVSDRGSRTSATRRDAAVPERVWRVVPTLP